MLEKLGTIQDKINELESQKQNTEMEYYQLGSDIGDFKEQQIYLNKKHGRYLKKVLELKK